MAEGLRLGATPAVVRPARRLIRRRCGFTVCSGNHTWEWLNPRTFEPFRRGRVVFSCRGPRRPS